MNGYTSHGHPIPGATIIAGMRPTSVARCGGPRMCTKCAIEAAAEQRRFSPVDGAPIPTDGWRTLYSTRPDAQPYEAELANARITRDEDQRYIRRIEADNENLRTAARRLLVALTDKPSTDGMTELAAAITTLRTALGEDAS